MSGWGVRRGRHYRGWDYDFNVNAPITGRWRATQHGVSICAGTEEALKRMIDAKAQDTAAWRLQ